MNFFTFFSKAKTNEAKTKDLRAPLLAPNRADEHDKMGKEMANQQTRLPEKAVKALRERMQTFSDAAPSKSL